MSMPNLITLARLISVPLIIQLILTGSFGWAFVVFLLAGISDAVDGYIAKTFNQVSTLGIYLDPIADKALIMSVYVALGLSGRIDGLVVLLVVFRDILIIGGVVLLFILKRQTEVSPALVSKFNTGAQIFLATIVLAQAALDLEMALLIELTGYGVIATTVASGAWYLVVWVRHFAGVENS